jgi:mannose-6-phosphate isomerase-like protein (cupin superfamily)
MKPQVIKSEKFGWKGVSGTSLDIGKKASLAHIKISTPISKRRSLRCDRTYFIISGTAEFTIGKKKTKVKKGEAIRIAKNTTYSYRPLNQIELVELNMPPINFKYEEVDL